jgi:hypothetical protein
MANFAVLDLIAPHIFTGAIAGSLHEFFTILFVTNANTAFDDNGVVITGVAHFGLAADSGLPQFVPPFGFTWAGKVSVDHRTARHDGAWWDLPDVNIQIRLTIPRVSSPVADLVVSGGPGGAPAPLGNAAVANLLASLGQGNGDAPNTAFRLELLLEAASLHLPFLRPAKLNPDGTLSPDASFPDVKVTFPKIKFTITQTNGAVAGANITDPQLSVALDSWAAQDIGDPAGTLFAELMRMEPPYAFFGAEEVLGFGFESIILDLSGTATPPALLSKFGVGDDFRGIYLPDVRIFVAPPGLKGLKIDVSARELLIGLGPEGGVSGIFGVDLVQPGKAQSAVVTVYDIAGRILHRIELPEAPNPPAAVPDFAADIEVPSDTMWVVDVSGGQPPYNVDLAGQNATAKAVEVTIAPPETAKTVPLHIEDVHAGGQSRNATFNLTLTAPPPGSQPTVAGDKDAHTTVLVAGPVGFGITVHDLKKTEHVILTFTPPNPKTATLTTEAGATNLIVANGTATVPLAHGKQIEVAATWDVAAVPAATDVNLDGFFKYAEPSEQQVEAEDHPSTKSFVDVADDIHHSPSRDESVPANDWTVPGDSLASNPAFTQWVAGFKATAGATAHLVGSASVEKQPNPIYNINLSQRRIWALEELLRRSGVTNLDAPEVKGEGFFYGPGRGENRRVVAIYKTGGSLASVAQNKIEVKRDPRDPVPEPYEPKHTTPEAAGTPALGFRELHVRVAIDHSRLIAIEILLKIDVETALEHHLSTVQANNPGKLPAPGPGEKSRIRLGKQADPNDGVIDMRLQLTLDDTVGRWQLIASLFENDKDGFLQSPPPTADDEGTALEQALRTYFGVLVALAPLLDQMAAANTIPGSIVTIETEVAVPLLAVQTGVVHVPRITLYGGEFRLTHDNLGTRGALLLDVEVALIISLGIGGAKLIDTDPKNPIKVRYRAVGFATSNEPKLGDLVPVFDSSKGYTIDIPSGGGVHVPGPLGDILQVTGARIARSNPVNVELDLTLKADLGVVTVDRTTIRIPIGGGVPTIGALGVHIDIPGAIEGRGYVAIYPDGFGGQLDVSLVGLGIRIAAGLSVRHVTERPPGAREATAVLLTLDVEFPVPILLGNSGLGIYGFLGLFALHHTRDEHPADPVPALDWLMRLNGNPLDITGWRPEIDDWAIGVGAVLGTVDAGFTLNVKGVLVFELPGPRILLVMKARLLWPRPPRGGKPDATILAVIDVDLGRGMITVGVSFDYKVEPLLSIHVPVRAIFRCGDPPNFAVDAGTWYMPATVTFFKMFTARGYFMIRGRDIPSVTYDKNQPPFPLAKITGFAIATGVSASFTWGNEDVGLYVKVGSSADFALGFSPIMFTGQMRMWGELHLWVVGVEASAQLKLIAGQQAIADGHGTRSVVWIDGEASGEVDLFFFTIKGSVHVTLGPKPDAAQETPPNLVNGVTLHSRSAALVTGTGLDRPIDGKLTDARTAGPFPDEELVPIDAIPVVHFDCVARVPAGVKFHTTADGAGVDVAIGPPQGSAAAVVRRGEPYYAYRLKAVSLSDSLTKGAVLIVWWTPPGKDIGSAETKIQLALLTRVPYPHPSAVERSRHLTEDVKNRWSTVCDPVAPPTSVLWTFAGLRLGVSASGWTMDGLAWPDPPGSTRSVPVRLTLSVAEIWRTGSPLTDLLKPVIPARVVGGVVPCDPHCARGAIDHQPPLPPVTRLDESLHLLDVLLYTGADPSAMIIAAHTAGGAGSNGAAPLQLAPDMNLLGNLGIATSNFQCAAKALEAPFRQGVNLALIEHQHPLGDVLAGAFKSMFEEVPNTPPRLDDVVAYSPGDTRHMRLLLLVPTTVLNSQRLLLRSFGEGGDLLADTPIDGAGRSRIVNTVFDLPPTWLDRNGPWFCPVAEVLILFACYLNGRNREHFRLVLVDTDTPEGTFFLHTGIRGVEAMLHQGTEPPSYLVGVVETLSAAEVRRRDEEERIAKYDVQTINGALAGLPDPPALMKPNTVYTVRVEWEWAKADAHGSVPKEADAGTWHAGTPQEFKFHTDNQPLKPAKVKSSSGEGQPDKTLTMPVRLDPWVLTTDPDEGTAFFFYDEPITVVFGADYLFDMYKTYGVLLEGKVRAASYRNADPASPGYLSTVKEIGVADLKPIMNAAVFKPWEATVRESLSDKQCVATSGDYSRHNKLTLNLLLEPRTDYIFDIQAKGAPDPPPGSSVTPLFRRKFTTGRYKNAEDMCAHVAGARVDQRPASVADIAALVALGAAPGPLAGSAVDDALRAAGLRPTSQVDFPETELLWVAEAGGLQPRVVIVRTPEPLIRVRSTPVDHKIENQPRLQTKVTRLEPVTHLDVVATAGNPNAPAMQLVGAAGFGTLIILLTAARGKTLDLSLRRRSDPYLDGTAAVVDIELLRIDLRSAPWEEL